MRLKLSCYQHKIDCYVYKMSYVSPMVNTQQKPTADSEKIDRKWSRGPNEKNKDTAGWCFSCPVGECPQLNLIHSQQVLREAPCSPKMEASVCPSSSPSSSHYDHEGLGPEPGPWRPQTQVRESDSCPGCRRDSQCGCVLQPGVCLVGVRASTGGGK